MGPDYVRSMCHDIEDPTFDATAVATNPRAQVRPVHRPPRTPAGRTPHCAWTVTIADDHPPVCFSEGCVALQSSRAASLELDPIDPSSPGRSDYSGPLLADLDFAEFSHSALVRIADEVCLQMHLLFLGFRRAVFARLPADEALEICVKQLTGIAGVAASRLARRSPCPPPSRAPSGCCRCTRCSTRSPTSRPRTPPPTRTEPGSPWSGPRRSAPSRRSSARSTPTSTWRSPDPPGPWRSYAATNPPRSRRGRGHPVQLRGRLHLRTAAVAADHAHLRRVLGLLISGAGGCVRERTLACVPCSPARP